MIGKMRHTFGHWRGAKTRDEYGGVVGAMTYMRDVQGELRPLTLRDFERAGAFSNQVARSNDATHKITIRALNVLEDDMLVEGENFYRLRSWNDLDDRGRFMELLVSRNKEEGEFRQVYNITLGTANGIVGFGADFGEVVKEGEIIQLIGLDVASPAALRFLSGAEGIKSVIVGDDTYTDLTIQTFPAYQSVSIQGAIMGDVGDSVRIEVIYES